MADFRNLSIPDRLELIEAIWQSIAEDADSFVLTHEQEQRLEEQLDAFYVNPEPGQPVSETLETLRDPKKKEPQPEVVNPQRSPG